MELIKEKEPTQLKYPVDWEMLNLGKSSVLKARIGWQGLTTAEYLDAGDYYLITGTDFKHGYIDWDNCVYVEKLRYDQDKNIQVKEDDVLVTKDGTIGKVAFVNNVPKKTTLNSGVFVIRPVHKSYYPRYFYYVLMSEHFKDFLGKLTAGSTISHLYQKDFVHYEFPLPPTLTEQKAIATALSDVDALIASLEQTITKKKSIKQGAMQQLLTPPHKGGKRLSGFEGEWMEKKLGDIGDCIRGVSYNGSSDLYPFDNNNSIRLLRSNNVFDKKIVFQNLQYVKKEKVNSHQIIQPKDILICMANGSKALVGKAGQFNGANMKYTFGAFMGILRPNIDECDGDFIFNLFSTNSFRCHLDIQLSGSSINNLKPSDIEDFKFYSPNYPEQQAIAQILSDMDAEITQLESKKEKYQAIKQGMMQELLTGKTRLV